MSAIKSKEMHERCMHDIFRVRSNQTKPAAPTKLDRCNGAKCASTDWLAGAISLRSAEKKSYQLLLTPPLSCGQSESRDAESRDADIYPIGSSVMGAWFARYSGGRGNDQATNSDFATSSSSCCVGGSSTPFFVRFFRICGIADSSWLQEVISCCLVSSFNFKHSYVEHFYSCTRAILKNYRQPDLSLHSL